MPERVSNALLLGLGILVAIALAAFWPIPVKAQECIALSEFFDGARDDANFTALGRAVYDGQNSDTVIIYRSGDSVRFAIFNDGCYQSGPFALDLIAEDKGTPA